MLQEDTPNAKYRRSASPVPPCQPNEPECGIHQAITAPLSLNPISTKGFEAHEGTERNQGLLGRQP